MNDELKAQIRKYYESNRISAAELARQSKKLFNKEVPATDIRKWASVEGWTKPPLESNNQAMAIIANMLFDKLEEEGPNMSASELATLARTYLEFSVKGAAGGVDDQRPTIQRIMQVVGDRPGD